VTLEDRNAYKNVESHSQVHKVLAGNKDSIENWTTDYFVHVIRLLVRLNLKEID
jgi:hypothetical protein